MNQMKYKIMKWNIYVFDFLSELIVLILSSVIFIYTDITTIGGFLLTAGSTMLDFYYSYRELLVIEEY